eukprot:1147821-Pelagomonas_calceolata.AAC.15
MAVISKHIKVIEISGAQLMRKRSRVGRGEGIKIIKRHSIAFIVSQALFVQRLCVKRAGKSRRQPMTEAPNDNAVQHSGVGPRPPQVSGLTT